MKFFNKVAKIVTLLFVILYPILPTYGAIRGDYLIYLLALLEIVQLVISKEERNNIINIFKNYKENIVLLSLISLNVVMYLSTVFATDKRIALTHSIRFSMYLFIFYWVCNQFKFDKFKNTLVYAFVLTAALSGIVTIYQISQLTKDNSILGGNNRIASFLENSNNLGAFSILSIFIVIMLFINSKNNKLKVFYAFTTLLLLVNIVLSQSRNALIGLFIGCILIAIIYDKRFLIFSAAATIVLLLIPASRIRIFQIFDLSQNSSRLKIWNTSIDMISDNPLFGVGYNNFSTNYQKYVDSNPDKLFISEGYLPDHPHNVFLKFQTELGILGTIVFIVFLIITALFLYKSISVKRNIQCRNLTIGILSGFISFNIMNLLDCYYSAPKIIITMLITLALGINYINSKKKAL